VKQRFLNVVRMVAFALSGLVLALLLFAFTDGPFYLLHWLATSAGERSISPTHIVMLGGGGYPGEQTLLRSWHAAQLAARYPSAGVLISQASEPGPRSAAELLKEELCMRGVAPARIQLQTNARNTREEALFACRRLSSSSKILLVTSPEHVRRSVMAFEAAGFNHVAGHPAYSDPGIPNLCYASDSLGGRQMPVLDPGHSTQFRYRFWNHLHYELLCLREFIALGWYRLNGWC
jgi:uncharacterized SAM-binding protein YcdF (DUF218 family)